MNSYNTQEIINEMKKAVIGKDEILRKVLMALLAEGHVLLEDIPGVGKTTVALAFRKVFQMDYNRIQFTPDTMPSDVIGFTMYQKETGTFEYRQGAIMSNMILADEINRTSSKTQAALLEAMEEGQITVDGVTHILPDPFFVIATQNPYGTAGTQALPESQLDRFIICLSMGYPDTKSEIAILRGRHGSQPLDTIRAIANIEELQNMRKNVQQVQVSDYILEYITRLLNGTREHEEIEIGVSTRGGVALTKMAKACAFLNQRTYVIPEDVMEVFVDVCCHRIILKMKARTTNQNPLSILQKIKEQTKIPQIDRT